jgi:hypothetical protein
MVSAKTKYRFQLIGLMLLSGGIDGLMWVLATWFSIPTFFTSYVVDEVIEYGISNLLAKTAIDTKVTKLDKIIGLVPIPLITSITIRCKIELFKSFNEKDKTPKKL